MKQIRRRRDLSQRYLAERLGVSVQAVSNWERGRRSPDLATARRIAELLAVPIDAIVFPREQARRRNGKAGAR